MSEDTTIREEFDNLLSLVKSQEWNLFLRLKERHSIYLQHEMSRLLARGDYRLADRAQAKLEENSRDVELLRKRMDELKKALPKEEDFNNER